VQFVRLQEPLGDRLGIEPGRAQTLADETDATAHAQFKEFFRERRGKTRQRIDQMSQAHQIMVTAHGIPVLRKRMFVMIALTFFDQETGFNPPAMAAAEIAALMHIVGAQGAAGDPNMFRLAGDVLCVLVDFLPCLMTHHDVQGEVFAIVGRVFVTDNSFLDSGVTPKSYSTSKPNVVGQCYPVTDEKGIKKPALRPVQGCLCC